MPESSNAMGNAYVRAFSLMSIRLNV
jgi:hypothetical protein